MRRARILKAADIRVGDARSPKREDVEAPEADDSCDGEIEVELRRVDDLVEAILVKCPCGRTTEVECLYDALETED